MDGEEFYWTEEDLKMSNGSMLNGLLARSQGLTKQDIEYIKHLHEQKDRIMRDAHEAVKRIEFDMQEAWGFKRDEKMHTWRHMIPNPE